MESWQLGAKESIKSHHTASLTEEICWTDAMGLCLCLAERQQETERGQDLYKVLPELRAGVELPSVAWDGWDFVA